VWVTSFVSGQKSLSGITAEAVSADYSLKLHFKTFSSSFHNQRCLVSLHARKSLNCNSGLLEGSSVGILVSYEKCQNVFIETSTFLYEYGRNKKL
jgi:hypothetical protein